MLIFSYLLLIPSVLANCNVETACSQLFNRCYTFVATPTNFVEAQQNCVNLGGNLTSIQSKSEDSSIRTLASSLFTDGSIDFWIGAFSGKIWRWLDDSGWDYDNWFPVVEPRSVGGAATLLTSGYWRSSNSSDLKPYVCVVPYNPISSWSGSTTCKPCSTKQQPTVYKCDSTWTFFEATNACYKVISAGDYTNSEQRCAEVGAHLTSIHSEEENEFVADLTSTGYNVDNYDEMTWIGLTRDANSTTGWKWEDDSEVTYSKWADFQPDDSGSHENCVQIYSDHLIRLEGTGMFGWNDLACNQSMRRAVCKKSMT